MTNVICKSQLSGIKIDGKDACDFLHRLTSQEIKSLQNGSSTKAALLTANANIISWFQVFRKNQTYLLVVDQCFGKPTFDELEKMHFAEELKIELISFDSFYIGGPKAQGFLEDTFGKSFIDDIDWVEVLWKGTPHWIFKASGGFVITAPLEDFKEELTKQDFKLLESTDEFRLEMGQPKFGMDLGSKNLILEGPFADYVSRNKGCYPGQEIVERVFTYGNVTKKLMKVKIPNGCLVKIGDTINVEDSPIGTITSLGGDQAFTMIKKPWFKAGTQGKIAGHTVTLDSIPGTFEIR